MWFAGFTAQAIRCNLRDCSNLGDNSTILCKWNICLTKFISTKHKRLQSEQNIYYFYT